MFPQHSKKTETMPSAPEEFVATNHGAKRMEERFRCNGGKIIKIIEKAWNSKETVDPLFIYRKSKEKRRRLNGWHCRYKFFLGHVFVFSVKNKTKKGVEIKKLITVFNPKIDDKKYD